MTDDKAQADESQQDGAVGKPSQAEGDAEQSEEHEVLESTGKPSQAEGGDEGEL